MTNVRHLEYVPLDEILPTDLRNPKDHAIPETRASIGRFGFLDIPVIDERSGRLIAGHGRLESLTADQAEGKEPPDGILIDETGRWTVPVIRGWSSRNDVEAEAAAVALNRLAELGGWNVAGLTAVLNDISSTSLSLEGIGYTADELVTLIASTAPPSFQPGDADPPPRLDVRTPIICPKCSHHFFRS